MKRDSLFIKALILGLLLHSCAPKHKEAQVDYFGQKIPLYQAEVFAPGIISLENRWEGNANFSPDGKTFYFNVFTDSMKIKSIYRSQFQNGKWNKAEKFEILGDHNNWEPFINYSGDELFFVSARPPGNEEWNGRIWSTKRNKDGNWSPPQIIDLRHQTENGFWFPNHARNNRKLLYFGGNIEDIGTVGQSDLYRYSFETDTVINLKVLNSPKQDWDPFIAPDGSYLLWASDREGGFGGTDIYISFNTEGTWGDPINLGEQVNSADYEVAPRISSDGKVLFFDRPKNRTQDIFWISSAIISDFRK